MTQVREFITPVQRGKLPSFVRADYPAFAKYIVDYFTFLEEDGNALEVIEEWRGNADPDTADSPYIDAILKDLGWTWTGSLQVTKKLLLKNLRDFYLSRGTKRSFEFLFRTLFGESVQIRYPREEMLYLDQANYASEITLYATAANRLAPSFLAILDDLAAGKNVEVIGQISGTVATVESINTLLAGDAAYFQITILQPLTSFVPREEIMIFADSGFVIETSHAILGVEIDAPGYGFNVGDEIAVDGPGLAGLIRVSALLAGGIESLTIVTPGTGYQLGDVVTAERNDTDYGYGFFGVVDGVNGGGGITSIKLTDGGKEYKTIPKIAVKSSTGGGAVVTGASATIGAIARLRVYQPFVDFESISTTVEAAPATFTITESATFTTRRYKDRRGVLGENSTLIDSDRFQQFSYDLLTAVPKSQHRDVVDDLLHPVGYVRTDVLRFDQSVDETVTQSVGGVVGTGVQDVLLKSIAGNGIITIDGRYIQVRK